MQANWALVRWFPWFQGQSSSSLPHVNLMLPQDNGEGPREVRCTPSANSPWGRHWLVLMMLGLGWAVLLCQVPQKGVLALASVV